MHFTPREQEILHLLAQHRTYAEMATILDMRVKNVRTHVQNIVMKTDVHKQIHLAGYAITQGFGRKGSHE